MEPKRLRTEDKQISNHDEMIGNEIGVEGAKALGEMLKVNKTLSKLNMRGKQE